MKQHRFRVKTARLEQVGSKPTWFPVEFTVKAENYPEALALARKELYRRYEIWDEEHFSVGLV